MDNIIDFSSPATNMGTISAQDRFGQEESARNNDRGATYINLP